MYHSGVGGGGFMLVRSPNGSYEFIDFRETAPAAAFEDMYKNNTEASIFGGLARYVKVRTVQRVIFVDTIVLVVFLEKFEDWHICMRIMEASPGRQ